MKRIFWVKCRGRRGLQRFAENSVSVTGDLLGALERPGLAEDDGADDGLLRGPEVGANVVCNVAGVDGRVVNRRTGRGRFLGYAGLFGLAQLLGEWCVTVYFLCRANQRRGYRCAGANHRGQINRFLLVVVVIMAFEFLVGFVELGLGKLLEPGEPASGLLSLGGGGALGSLRLDGVARLLEFGSFLAFVDPADNRGNQEKDKVVQV